MPTSPLVDADGPVVADGDLTTVTDLTSHVRCAVLVAAGSSVLVAGA